MTDSYLAIQIAHLEDFKEKTDLKGTHTVYFSSTLYIINQKPMIPRIYFHYISTWVARPSG